MTHTYKKYSNHPPAPNPVPPTHCRCAINRCDEAEIVEKVRFPACQSEFLDSHIITVLHPHSMHNVLSKSHRKNTVSIFLSITMYCRRPKLTLKITIPKIMSEDIVVAVVDILFCSHLITVNQCNLHVSQLVERVISDSTLPPAIIS